MSGLGAVKRKVAQLAETRATEKRSDIAHEAEALSGVTASVEGEDVVFEGRRLLDRWIRDASIRNIGRLER